MAKSWQERYDETRRKSTGELEEIREARLERGEETGVIDQVLSERAEEEEAYKQDQEDQRNW